jgi:AcrR family transcriptional regulator
MATRKPKASAAAEVDDDAVPEWKRQSADRSLKAARARALERTDRFVAAAMDLMAEQGGTDFTVQDVIDHTRMSIRTFYNFFASKDDLLAAVYETVIGKEVTPRLRKRCEKQTDPILRIRAYIEGLYELTADRSPVSRALTTYHNRLLETRPADLDRAFQPQIELVSELLQNAIDAGVLKPMFDLDKMAHLLHHTVLAIVHARVLGATLDASVSADEMWLFCAQGIGVNPGSDKRR